MLCIVLHCTVLDCIELNCTAVHCTVLYSAATDGDVYGCCEQIGKFFS
jgi:hypothetical protein